MRPVSMQTLELLSDELAQWWTLAEVHSLFESAGIPVAPAWSDSDDARRKSSSVRQYLGSLNSDDPEVGVRLSWVLDEVLAHVRLVRSQDLYALTGPHDVVQPL